MSAKTKTQQKVFRLRDIVTEEVSLVDRAANKRKFLVVKADAGAEVVEGADGKLTTSKDAPPGEGPGADAPNGATTFKLPAGTKAGLLQGLSKVVQELTALGQAVQGAEESPDQAGLPEQVVAPLSAIADALEEVVGSGEDAGAEEPGVSDEATPPQNTAPSEAGKSMTELEKRGAKMAKDRLEQFIQATNILNGILTELKGTPAGRMMAQGLAAASKPQPTAPAPAAPAGAPAPAATAPAAPAAKNEELEKKLAAALASVEKLTTQVAKQGEHLTRLTKARGMGNAVQPEGMAPPPAEVAWPRDMNRPVTRETTSKDTSFFEDRP